MCGFYEVSVNGYRSHTIPALTPETAALKAAAHYVRDWTQKGRTPPGPVRVECGGKYYKFTMEEER